MRELIITGKTVEEATELACAELGVSEADVTVEIIDLPQKKLFKTIPAKVRVCVEEEEEVAASAPVEAPVAQKPAASKAAAAPANVAPKAAATAEEELLETPVTQENMPKADAAVAYLREVAEKMDASNVEIVPVQRGEALVLKVSGDDAGTLIGHRGEVMESLSYLCGLVANKLGGDYTRVNLDVNNYRSKRESNLVALAKRIGAKVAKSGRSHTLEPMNPYERRIIHSAIGEMEGVKSESTGEGANRRVVISSTNPRAGGYNRPARDNNRGGYNRNTNGAQRSGSRDGGNRSGGYNKPGADRGPRRESNVPRREFADTPRDTSAAPSVPVRTEKINDGANLDLPLYGKIEL